jgi:hypothetical protein|tara:strand:- start:131 stop:376 length:246 start_codon:yes stop_codon:yes gene_type:complete
LRRAIFSFIILFFVAAAGLSTARGQRAKFYDFNEQLIDGERKRPVTLYTNARQQVKFDRLLRLKKSFLPRLFNTAKEKVFK